MGREPAAALADSLAYDIDGMPVYEPFGAPIILHQFMALRAGRRHSALGCHHEVVKLCAAPCQDALRRRQ